MERRRPRKRGRPCLLTPDVEKVLVDNIRGGAPYTTAAALAGVSDRVVVVWLARGRDELWARDQGLPEDADEQLFVDFFGKVQKARAQAAQRAILQIQKVAAGGIVTEESTETRPDGTVVTTVRRSAPDWKAAAWYLERQHRAEFGRAASLEVTGADGGAIQVEHSVNVEALSARIHEQLSDLQVSGGARLEIEAPVDAEIVDG